MKRTEVVDAIGEIDAQIAELQAQRDKLIARLAKPGTVEGEVYVCTAFVRRSTWLDPKKVRRRLGTELFSRCFSSKETLCHRITEK